MSRAINRYYLVLALFIGIHLLAIFIIAPDVSALEKYNLTIPQARMLRIAIAAPLGLIWFAAFYGFVKLKEYTALIIDSLEGQALDKIATGQMVLAFSLPFGSLSNTVITHVNRQMPEAIPAVVIIRNYLTIAITLAAFVLIARGAAELRQRVKKQLTTPRNTFVTIIFTFLAVAYVYLMLENPIRQAAVVEGQRATFYLPDWLLITTVVAPYLYIWYRGLQASMDIALYKNRVAGRIYKPFLGSLAVGLGWVIISSIALQFFTATTDTVARLGLRSILVLIYVLLLVIGIGYIKIALGAKKLKRIEEV